MGADAEGEDIARIMGCAVVSPYFEAPLLDTEEALQDLQALNKFPSCSALVINYAQRPRGKCT